MKIECLKENLADVLNKAERIASKNLTMPILSCILLDATTDRLIIRSTNLELALQINIPAKIIEKGIVALPAHVLSAYIATIDKDKNVTLELLGQNLKISSNSNTTLIKTVQHEDFPNIPSMEDPISFTVKPSLFVDGCKAVSYASAQTSMKPELSSIYIYTDDGSVVFVATDSFRLAEKKVKIKTTDEWSTLIPIKNIPDIVRILETINEDVEVMVSKHQIVFRNKGLYLTSRVVEGTFPDYRQIIPKGHKTEATVLKQDVLRAFKIATIFSDKFNKLSIKALPQENRMEIKTMNTDVGETLTSIEGVITGEDVDVNFNYKYISDCFQSIQATSAVFHFNGVGKLTIGGVGDASFIYLVMPMNR